MSMQISQLNNKQEGIFFPLLLLTGFFLLLEVSFFIQCNRVYFSDYTFVSDSLHIPITILPGILFFLCAQLSIHLGYCFFIWCVAELVNACLGFVGTQKILLGISIWFLGLLTIVTANQYDYPNSKFAELSMMVLPTQQAAKWVLMVLLSGCGAITGLALIGWYRILKHKCLMLAFALLTTMVALSGYFILHTAPKASVSAATSSHPNVILIGIDSLRPDFLGYFGSERSTPFLDDWLEQASVFSEAVTPLARTFPSWSVILTGQYPYENAIRTNLARTDHLYFNNSLPALLQRNHYQTIYATDETRFSNIDTHFGFDQIITPPTGLNDFLLGTFNDFPLSNLLINTRLGQWLFPYSYANRPAYFAYQPNSFLNLIQPALNGPHDKPLFLAAHFCLPHYPYLWASLSGRDFTPQERYVKSIERVDKQISDFFIRLKRAGLLEHAIVILLSDHGEALELSGDRITDKAFYIPSSAKTVVPKFYPPSLDEEEVNQSAGHGTDVLGLPQYHTLLAFKLYGVEPQSSGMKTGVVTLLDIKPTLLDLLHIPMVSTSGVSLAGMIKGDHSVLPSRHLFMESDFSPEAVRTVYPEARKVLLEGIDLFKINPQTTRLTVKDEMTIKIIRSKQYADIYSDWMLALYPQSKTMRTPILINLMTGQWTNDLQSAYALASPAADMLKALRQFYGDEIFIVSTEKARS